MSIQLTREDGRRLAVDLLHALDGIVDESEFDDGQYLRPRNKEIPSPQALLREQLSALYRLDSQDVQAGFCDVLADFIVTALDGATQKPSYYERNIDAPLR